MSTIAKPNTERPVVLTIAGFDPSGGAGTIADIKTFVHFHCRPVAAITSLTFQNSQAVFGMTHESADSLRAQILPIVEEFRLAAIKTGMSPTAEIVLEVARLIREDNLVAPVIDPVLYSSSGSALMDEEAVEPLLRELMPLARVITPNVSEAERLAGLRIENEEGMHDAARALREIGAQAVLIKGGHLLRKKSEVRSQKSGETQQAVDILDDGGQVSFFRSGWIDTHGLRGTGCMLSSGIAACLAQGMNLGEAVRLAKQFVADALRDASNLEQPPVTLELTEFMKSGN